MYFCMNLKMKKLMLHCCFTWIVFIELNFTVRFAYKVGGWGIFSALSLVKVSEYHFKQNKNMLKNMKVLLKTSF